MTQARSIRFPIPMLQNVAAHWSILDQARPVHEWFGSREAYIRMKDCFSFWVHLSRNIGSTHIQLYNN